MPLIRVWGLSLSIRLTLSKYCSLLFYGQFLLTKTIFQNLRVKPKEIVKQCVINFSIATFSTKFSFIFLFFPDFG